MAHIVILGAGIGGVPAANAKTAKVEPGKLFGTQLDDPGQVPKALGIVRVIK